MAREEVEKMRLQLHKPHVDQREREEKVGGKVRCHIAGA